MNTKEISIELANHGYKMLSFIGKGGFSICYSVLSQKYNQEFVCKILTLSGFGGKDKKKTFQNEITTLTKTIHPNIIKVFDVFSTRNFMFLILDNCPNGDFNKYVKMNGPIRNIDKLLSILFKILDALAYLEDNNIAHKDIKPANILISNNWNPIIADFGLATYYKDNELCNDFTGSPIFTAPEVVSRKPYNSFKADVWSFGITVFFLATGKYPFPMNKSYDVREAIKNGFLTIPRSINSVVLSILKECLVMEPDKRMSFSQLRDLVYNAMEQKNTLISDSRKPWSIMKSTSRIITNNSLSSFKSLHSSTALLMVSRNILRRV